MDGKKIKQAFTKITAREPVPPKKRGKLQSRMTGRRHIETGNSTNL